MFYDHIIVGGYSSKENRSVGIYMIGIQFRSKLRKSLSNFASAYDSYTVGLLIAGAIMIAIQILRET